MIIAVSAYVCTSNRGSEHELGWKCIKENAALADELHLFASTFENSNLKEQIEINRLNNVKVITLDISKYLAALLKSIPFFGYHMSAYLWEISLFFYMRKRYRKEYFDLAVKSSYGSYRWPTFLWYFSKKLDLGPFTGGGRFPIRFLSIFTFKGKLFELGRMLSQYLPFIDPFVLLSLLKASKIYVGNEATKTILPIYARKKCIAKENFLEVFPEDFKMKEAKENIVKDHVIVKLFYTGKALEWKGLMLVFKALKNVGSEIKYEFTIMGEGPSKRIFQKYVKKNDLKVQFIDPVKVPRNELSYYFLNHDIFVFPSLRGEGGLAPMEAKMHEMNLLTLDFSGLDTILDENDIVINTKNKKVNDVIKDIGINLVQYYNLNKQRKQ